MKKNSLPGCILAMACVRLLTHDVLAEFPVVEFGAHTQSLDEVFLQVTKGLVQ